MLVTFRRDSYSTRRKNEFEADQGNDPQADHYYSVLKTHVLIHESSGVATVEGSAQLRGK